MPLYLPLLRALLVAATYALTNGHWLVHGHFERRTMYAVDGVLRHHRPPHIDTVIDLRDTFVVPPFGDAHAHHFDSPRNIRQIEAMNLADGIFYGMSLTNSIAGKRAVASEVNRPDRMDVAYADAGLTATLGHPIEVYEALALGLYGAYGHVTPDSLHVLQAAARRSHLADGDAYFVLDSAADLDRQWPRIVASHPDLLKIFLQHSERYDSLRRDTAVSGNKGLDPTLVPLITRRAHAAGLRVAAHVQTPADFHVAVAGGVDIIAHLPGYEFDSTEDPATYQLSRADAKLAARRGVVVIPTAWLASSTAGTDSAWLARMQRAERHNLALLRDAGVRIALGSDYYGRDALNEVLYLHALGGWSNRALLTAWAVTTPQVIFPKRRVGCLDDGCDASFLALAGDPLADFGNVQRIALRVKTGRIVTPAR